MGFISSRVLAAARDIFIAASLMAVAADAALAADPKPSASAKAQGVMVIVTTARNACFSSTVRANGILQARAEAMVIPEVDGARIIQVNAKPGDSVTSGQTLAQLARADGQSITVRSPANGLVVKSTAALGGLASARAPDPLFRIAVDGEIELAADVPSVFVPKIAPGQTARVVLEDGRDLPGRVRRVPSEINPVTQLGQVRIAVESDPSLRVGTFARATIDAARSCGVSIPRSAVYFRTEGASVQVVQDRTVETRKIQVGIMSDDAVEVREGIREGEMVIANAGGSLRNGEKVRPVSRDESTGELQER
jgi:multidrug efflux pump subunit AcrA (membrane-fusion protein)